MEKMHGYSTSHSLPCRSLSLLHQTRGRSAMHGGETRRCPGWKGKGRERLHPKKIRPRGLGFLLSSFRLRKLRARLWPLLISILVTWFSTFPKTENVPADHHKLRITQAKEDDRKSWERNHYNLCELKANRSRRHDCTRETGQTQTTTTSRSTSRRSTSGSRRDQPTRHVANASQDAHELSNRPPRAIGWTTQHGLMGRGTQGDVAAEHRVMSQLMHPYLFLMIWGKITVKVLF